MPKIFKQNELAFEPRKSPIPEFLWHTSPNLAKTAEAKQLKFDVRSLDPGKFSYPYHSHRNAEEIFYIISGKATLRTPEGFEEVTEGDIIFFEMGPAGAHQLYNHTEEPCKYLDICTFIGMDICDYPDSGKVNILGYQEIYKKEDKVDYYTGEDKVIDKWPVDIVKKP